MSAGYPDSPDETQSVCRSCGAENSPFNPSCAACGAHLEEGDAGARLAPGTVIGHLVVAERLGEGGMGVVHAAEDKTLERRVALKLLRWGAFDEAMRDRLVREARAMARLNHPNVAVVHEVGTFRDRLYLAMELVDGVSLAEWLRGERATGAIIDMFLQAGRGLAAAHEAGIVHRDFKPANVMVGRDGRARILDFGLARVEPVALAGAGRSSEKASSVAGTPAYMAPEQRRGEAVSPRSDQYSFCLALGEALRGKPEEARVRRILDRGLAKEPEARWPDLAQLLDALAAQRAWSDPAGRRRRRLWLAGSLGLAVTGIVASRAFDTSPAATCQPAAELWSARTMARVRTAFLGTGLPYAASSADRVEQALAGRAVAWAAARQDACEDTHVRGEQSEALLDLRMRCLDRRAAEMSALVEVLAAGPNKQVVTRGVRVVGALASLEACADADALSARVPLPADPALVAEIERFEKSLDRAKALGATGRYAEAIAFVSPVSALARGIGYAPLLADALQVQGRALAGAGDHGAAVTMLEQALVAAGEARDDEQVVESIISLSYWVTQLEHYDAAAAYLQMGRALVARLGQDRLIEGRLLDRQGLVLQAQGKLAEARVAHERALAIFETRGGDNHAIAMELMHLGNVYQRLQNAKEAVRNYRRALAPLEAAVGADHPDRVVLLGNLGLAQRLDGDLQGARETQRAALALAERVFPPSHPGLPAPLANLALTMTGLGAYVEAEALFRRALAIAETVYGPNHSFLASITQGLGSVLRKQGRAAEAEPVMTRAVEIHLKASGPQSTPYANALGELAEVKMDLGALAEAQELLGKSLAVLEKAEGSEFGMAGYFDILGELRLRRGDVAGAREATERALAIMEKQFGATHPDLMGLLVRLAQCALRAGRPVEALPHIDRAVAIGEERRVDPVRLTQARAVQEEARASARQARKE